MKWLLLVVAGLSLVMKSRGTAAVDECEDLILSDTVPAGFDNGITNQGASAQFTFRECIEQTASVCRFNYDQGPVATEIREQEYYVLVFESDGKRYDYFYLSDSHGIFVFDDYWTNAQLIETDSGSCYTHELTTVEINGIETHTNETFLLVQVFGALDPVTVTFKALAHQGGTDVFFETSADYLPRDCSANDPDNHITFCGAFYTGDTCTPTCDRGYSNNGGTATCQADGSYSVTLNACQTKIADFCPTATPTSATYDLSGCTGTVDTVCTDFCDDGYNESSLFVCAETGEFEDGECTYIGVCPVEEITDVDNVETPSASHDIPCGSFATGDECRYVCDAGYATGPDNAGLQCLVSGWNATASCTVIADFCKVSDIELFAGDGVSIGDCTTRSVEDGPCELECDEDGFLPSPREVDCTGDTFIGWDSLTFECVTPLPTPAPVPTIAPTNFPLPTATTGPTAPVPPTPPVAPTTPTLNPFFLNQPTTNDDDDNTLLFVLGGVGGALLLMGGSCIAVSYQSTRALEQRLLVAGDEVKGDVAQVHYVSEQEYSLEPKKIRYNVFDEW